MSLFLAGTVLVGVGCKDYDDDINDINKRLDELVTGKITPMEQQITAMNTTISNLEAADKAIGDKITALQTDVTANKAAITALQTAQTQLKNDIDAIKANYVTKDFLTTTLGSYATTKYVGDAIAAVQTALGKYTTEKAITDAIEAAKQAAITAAGAATEAAFQSSFDAAVAAANLASDSDVQDAIDAYDTQIKEYLTTAITDKDGEIGKELARLIATAVGDLQKVIAGRLTSLMLIPELYVGGIETIELKSLAYTAWTVTSSKTAETTAQDGDAATTAESATDVRYHVNPTSVTDADVKDPSFVFEKVTTRAAVTNPLLNVTDWKIVDGVMTVSVKKVSGATIELGANNAYTAALKVPIADKHLGANETGTVVMSDYVKLAETTIEPKIAALIDANEAKPNDGVFEDEEGVAHYHFSDLYDNDAFPKTGAQDADPSIVAAYNEPIDLLSMVTGCYLDGDGEAQEISKEALAAAGLKFRFIVPIKPYTIGTNTTDQQQFAVAAVDADGKWTLTSKLPDGTLNNQAAIDKTPIVRVELIDVNNTNAIVDVRYFKVKWVREVMPPVDLKVLKTFEYTLGCADFTGEFIWSEMVNKVLGKLGKNGMSQAEFVATYAAPTIASADHTVGTVATAAAGGVELAYNFDAAADESAAAFGWTLTPEQIGNVIADLLATPAKEVKRVVNVTIKTQSGFGGEIKFAFEVIVKKPTLPSINGYNSVQWHTDYTLAYVYPVQYNTPDAAATCEYKYPVERLFADSKVVKGLNVTCGKWDLQFAKTQPTTGYVAVVTEPSTDGRTTGYALKKGATVAAGVNAATLTYETPGAWYAPDTDGASFAKKITLSLTESGGLGTDAAIGLLKKEATMKVWAQINAYNTIELTKFNLYFVEPLKVNNKLTDAYFVDMVMSGSDVDCSKAFTMTDFKDYIVAEVTTGTTEKEKYAADLYAYYAVTNITWDLANAKVNMKKDAQGNYVIDESVTFTTSTVTAENRFGVGCITMPDASTLQFKNVHGAKVEKTTKIFIPVTVTHKWGKVSSVVTIDLLPEEVAAGIARK